MSSDENHIRLTAEETNSSDLFGLIADFVKTGSRLKTTASNRNSIQSGEPDFFFSEMSEPFASSDEFRYAAMDEKTIRRRNMELDLLPERVHQVFHVADAIRTIAAVAFPKEWGYCGASVLGPVLTFYADWLVSRLHAQEINAVIVAGTSTKIVSNLVKNAIEARNANIEVIDLETPFEFTYLAAIDRLTREDIVEGVTAEKIGDLFDLFEIPKNSKELEQVIERDTRSQQIVDSVASFFLKDSIRKHIEDKCRKNRSVLLSHLRPLFNKYKKVAFADISDFHGIQSHLEKIMRIGNVPGDLFGFILLEANRPLRPASESLDCKSYLSEPCAFVAGENSSTRYEKYTNSSLCEQYFSCFRRNHRVLLGALSPRGNTRFSQAQQAILNFQSWWLTVGVPFISSEKHLKYSNATDELEMISRAIMFRLLTAPTSAEISLFGTVGWNNFQKGISMHPLLDAAGKLTLVNKGYSAVANDWHHAWPPALLGLLHEKLVDFLWRAPEDYSSIDTLMLDDCQREKFVALNEVPAKNIASVDVSIGGWSQYAFHIICPKCLREFTCDVAGTIIVSKPVICTGCNEILMLSYDAINEFLTQRHQPLLGNDVANIKQKISEIMTLVNHAAINNSELPLLAPLANEYFVALLNGIALKQVMARSNEHSHQWVVDNNGSYDK